METAKITVLIVDDHLLFREGLRLLFESKPGMIVVGEAGSGPEAVRIASETQPDFVILDIAMPGGNGIDAIPRLREVAPKSRVIALSTFEDRATVLEVLESGASGFVLKAGAFEELENAISRASGGHRYLSPSLTDDLIGVVLGKQEGQAEAEEGPLLGLSPRERSVFRLICEEKSPKEIAQELGISRKTVDIHKRNIMGKLGLRSDVGLVKLALAEGLMPGREEIKR